MTKSRFNLSNDFTQDMEKCLLQWQQGAQKLSSIPIPTPIHQPRTIIYENEAFRVFGYENANSNNTPLLICYALINRADILDLKPDRSLIAQLIKNRQNPYLIEWKVNQKTINYHFADYADTFLKIAINAVLKDAGCEKLVLIGVCQGGVMSLCQRSLHPESIAGVICLVTPVNFKTSDNLINHLVKFINPEILRQLNTNVPGAWITNFYQTLRPITDWHKKHKQLFSEFSEEKAIDFLTMQQWIQHAPDVPPHCLADMLELFYRDNGFINNSLKINDQLISLSKIDIPILNIFAIKDYIVPPSSSKALRNLIENDRYLEISIYSGHIGLMTSQKSLKKVSETISRWLVCLCD